MTQCAVINAELMTEYALSILHVYKCVSHNTGYDNAKEWQQRRVKRYTIANQTKTSLMSHAAAAPVSYLIYEQVLGIL